VLLSEGPENVVMILQWENKSSTLPKHFFNSAKILHLTVCLLCIIFIFNIKTDKGYENLKALR